MQTRRACCHDYPVELELFYIFLDLLLSGIGTGELQITGDCHIGQLFREAFQLLHIQDTGDVQAAVTDVNTNRHETPPVMIALNHLKLCKVQKGQRSKIKLKWGHHPEMPTLIFI